MPSKSGGSQRHHTRQQQASKRTTAQRGYDYDHEVNRTRLFARHTDGKRCWWCGLPMFKDALKNWDRKGLHAEHSKTQAKHGVGRTRADRLMHDTCNKQRGDGTRDDQRPVLLLLQEQAEADDEGGGLGHLAMGWPTWET